MTKKIPCKVISSVPIGVKNAEAQTARQMNERLHKFDESPIANFRFEHAREIAGSLKTFHIGMGISNTFPTGQILNYLA